ncbi:MAG: molybdopterin-dependent oxidoreductase [Nitrospirae bacterium]|nr:molybdopterin-dependent oxidoreductase [Nitrospirota bacterium]
MSKTVNLKIDGKEVHAPEGLNLIDAAKTAGIHIPNLCYMKGMRGVGACRLCLVEIEGSKAPMIACTTKVKEGMVVNTQTEKIQEMRKFVIDLILSIHPLDCMTCTKAGVCKLQKYAYDFELKESSFTRKKFGYPVDEANPFIKRDPDYCILCGRCVRVCKEQGTNVLEFMGRGVGAKVVTARDKPLQESSCTFCGSCVDACPVNALLEADRWRKGREWEYDKIKSVCLSCGNGCDITVSTKDGEVVKVNAGADKGSVERYICAIGRFGFDSLLSDARVTVPLKRTGKELKEISWEEALKAVAGGLKNAGEAAGIITTGGILNQDAFVLSKFASDAVKTKNVDTTVSLYADAASMKYSDAVQMDSADLFIVAGLNPSQCERALPALDAGIRKMASRGAKLIVINSGETKLSSIANLNIQGDEAQTLARIARAMILNGTKAPKEMEPEIANVDVTEEAEKAVEFLTAAKEPVIFTAPSLFGAAKNISMIVNAKVVAVPYEANARGVVAMGLVTEGKTYSEMIQGKGIKALYVIAEPPVNKRPDVDLLMVQTSYLTELAKQADIVLPSASFLESEGTVINYLGKVKNVTMAVEPHGEAKQHKDIFIALSKAMGTPIKESVAKFKAAFEKGAKPKVSRFEKKQGLDIDPAEFTRSVNEPLVCASRLLWLKEAEKAAV